MAGNTTSTLPPPVVTAREQTKNFAIELLARQQDNDFCDIVLYGRRPVGSDLSVAFEPIKGHKVTLASASPHLHDAFTVQGFVESNTKEYTIEEIEHPTLKLIVDFIYTGKFTVEGDIAKQVENVLIGADYLVIPKLVRACGQTLDSKWYLTASNCVSKMLFARKYHCDVLEAAACRTAAADVNALINQHEFLNLSGNDAVAMIKGLAANSPSIARPDDVCNAAIAWLECNVADRKQFADIVILQVPLDAMSAVGLNYLKGKESFYTTTGDWLLAVKKVMKTHADVGALVAGMLYHVQCLEDHYYGWDADASGSPVAQRIRDKQAAADLLARIRPK